MLRSSSTLPLPFLPADSITYFRLQLCTSSFLQSFDMSVEQHEQIFGESGRLPKIAERRREQRSDSTSSTRAASLEVAIRENLALEDHLESTSAGDSIEQSLKRLLSIRSVVSTTSSFAKRQQAAFGTTTSFREIGTGSIGKVFEHPGTIWAYKLPLTDDVSKLWNNCIMNRRIEYSFEQLGPLAWASRDPTCSLVRASQYC